MSRVIRYTTIIFTFGFFLESTAHDPQVGRSVAARKQSAKRVRAAAKRGDQKAVFRRGRPPAEPSREDRPTSDDVSAGSASRARSIVRVRMKSVLACVLMLSACRASEGVPRGERSPVPPTTASSPPDPVPVGIQARSISRGAVTDATILARLTEAAKGVQAGAVVPRVGLGDVAYPRSQAEMEAMGGFGVLLVTIVCSDPTELPMTVELRTRSGARELPLVTSRSGELPDSGVWRVFGRLRHDAVYLMPVFLTRGEASVEVHLAKKQFTLTVVKFSPSEPDALSPDLRYDFRPRLPTMAALQRLIDEELPVMTGLPLDEEMQSP
jgi:hypothetical protein